MQKKKILYIDDNYTNLELIQRLLAGKGYECLVVQDSLKSIDVAMDYQPDLVLLDIQMPTLSGYDVLKLLRQGVIKSSVPVIALTANAMPDDKRLCMEAGFSGYLPKPVFREELYRQVELHLNTVATG